MHVHEYEHVYAIYVYLDAILQAFIGILCTYGRDSLSGHWCPCRINFNNKITFRFVFDCLPNSIYILFPAIRTECMAIGRIRTRAHPMYVIIHFILQANAHRIFSILCTARKAYMPSTYNLIISVFYLSLSYVTFLYLYSTWPCAAYRNGSSNIPLVGNLL